MKKVEFNKALGNVIKKGDVVNMESQLAARLVKRKDAKYYKPRAKKKVKKED